MSNDFLKSMLDAQSNMLSSWGKMYSDMVNKDNPYAKTIESFLELQKKYVEALSGNTPFDPIKFYSDYFKSPTFDPKAFEFFTTIQKAYMDQLSQMQKGFPGFNFSAQNPFQFPDMTKWTDMANWADMTKWTEGMGSLNEYFDKFKQNFNSMEFRKMFEPATLELIDKMSRANTYYLNLYKFWKDIEKTNVKPTADELKKFASELTQKYEIAFNDMVVPFLPEQLQTLVKQPVDLIKKYYETTTNFYAPWIDNADELQELFVEGISGDSSKLSDFFGLVRDHFNKTFGAVLTSPSIGLNKRLVEQQSKTFDTMLNMLIISSDLSSRICAVQNEHVGSIIEKYFNLVENGTEAKSFNDFAEYWTSEIEKVYESYFATEEYAKLLGQLSTTAMEYKIEMNKLMEHYLEDTPIVTRSEMDSFYKTVYDLKKEIKALRKELGKPEAPEAPKTTKA